MTQHVTEKAETRSFARADEVRRFPGGRLELVRLGGVTIGRGIFEPGWRWSTSVKPIAGTSSCEAPHLQYHVAGTLRIRRDLPEFVVDQRKQLVQCRLIACPPREQQRRCG